VHIDGTSVWSVEQVTAALHKIEEKRVRKVLRKHQGLKCIGTMWTVKV